MYCNFTKCIVVISITVGLLSIVAYFVLRHVLMLLPLIRANYVCRQDIDIGANVCRPSCNIGYYSLPGMTECEPWIGCVTIQYIPKLKFLGQGVVKAVYMGSLDGRNLAINILQNENYKEDFLHGLNMIRKYQYTQKVVQLIGWCGETVYVTEYHPLGSGEHVNNILQLDAYKGHKSASARLQICCSYVSAIEFLHVRHRIMCDSNEPNKALSQFLIRSDLHFILNDLDALPEVNSAKNITCKCGHRELFGEYVAPEQLWPYDDEFDDARMPGYDEKTDIWKIPDVCNIILGDKSSSLNLHLLDIHTKCKQVNPKYRPTAAEVLRTYSAMVWKIWSNNDSTIF